MSPFPQKPASTRGYAARHTRDIACNGICGSIAGHGGKTRKRLRNRPEAARTTRGPSRRPDASNALLCNGTCDLIAGPRRRRYQRRNGSCDPIAGNAFGTGRRSPYRIAGRLEPLAALRDIAGSATRSPARLKPTKRSRNRLEATRTPSGSSQRLDASNALL